MGEARAALDVEDALLVRLERAEKGSGVDWYDADGTTYDARLSDMPSQHFDAE